MEKEREVRKAVNEREKRRSDDFVRVTNPRSSLKLFFLS